MDFFYAHHLLTEIDISPVLHDIIWHVFVEGLEDRI